MAICSRGINSHFPDIRGGLSFHKMPLLELYGGAYINALLQTSVTYYMACIVLHWIAPRVLSVQSIQVQSRQSGQVRREAWNSLGEAAEELSSVLHALL